MHFLIDGHNLIGKMPGLALSDSQDELELILRLKGWVAAVPSRQVTIYFDGSGFGGYSQRLSSKDIRVIFAPTDKEADDLLMAKLSGLRHAYNYTLVTSDRRIRDVAVISRVKVLKSEEFVAWEGFDYRQVAQEEKRPSSLTPQPEKEHNPVISKEEVAEWLELFGPEPELKPPPRKRKKTVSQRAKPKRKGSLATPKDRENPELEEADLDAWLALFGGEKSAPAKHKKSSGAKSKRQPKRRSGKPKAKPENPHGLSDEDLRAWNDYFGKDT